MENTMENKEIDFVARHYRKGRFAVDAGWRRLGIAPVSVWRKYRAAAAVAATVILSAAATILYKEYHVDDVPQQTISVENAGPLTQVKVIDFENAPLPEVVRQIEAVYGVKVDGVPASPEKYVLSLHYEGTPADLISVINSILETEMTVTEK